MTLKRYMLRTAVLGLFVALAMAAEPHHVDLTWTPVPNEPISGYEIYRSPTPRGHYYRIAKLAPGQTTYTDWTNRNGKPLQALQSFCYKVYGVSKSGLFQLPGIPCVTIPPGSNSDVAGEKGTVSKTFVDMTPAELGEAVPELKQLKPAESQDILPEILKRSGSEVAAFFENFPNTSCTEHIVSTVQRVSQPGKLHYDNQYTYMATLDKGFPLGRFQEYRANAKGELVQPQGIVTWGFVGLSVNFHPEYQADSRFRYLGREEVEKQDTYVVAFGQRPNKSRQPASISFLGRSGVAYLQGIAWIDPINFRILRLRTDIEQPESNVGLEKETVEVLYSEVNFTHSGTSLWLPQEVIVTGRLKQYTFHNLHFYSDYRVFTVQVQQKVAKP